MNKHLAAMKQTLKALTHYSDATDCSEGIKAVADLRAAIAEMEKAEPVAWHYKEKLPFGFKHHFTAYEEEITGDWVSLYTHPQQTELEAENAALKEQSTPGYWRNCHDIAEATNTALRKELLAAQLGIKELRDALEDIASMVENDARRRCEVALSTPDNTEAAAPKLGDS